jgi:hypothetical protein
LPLETPGNDTQDLELVGNTITDTVGDAIAFRDVATVDIHHNTITNCSSVGIMPITNYQGVRVHDNTVANCNISFRFLNMDEEVHQPKQIWLYNNCATLDAYGSHAYWHWNADGAATGQHEQYVYNNRFTGGGDGL